MRIVCPSCTTAYDVPDDRLVPERAVKCARCGTSWAPLPAVPADPAPPPAIVAEPQAVPVPMESAAGIPDTTPREPEIPVVVTNERPAVSATAPSRTAALGWVLSLVVLIGLGWSAYHWRVEVIQAWPPSERAYIALGLPR